MLDSVLAQWLSGFFWRRHRLRVMAPRRKSTEVANQPPKKPKLELQDCFSGKLSLTRIFREWLRKPQQFLVLLFLPRAHCSTCFEFLSSGSSFWRTIRALVHTCSKPFQTRLVITFSSCLSAVAAPCFLADFLED